MLIVLLRVTGAVSVAKSVVRCLGNAPKLARSVATKARRLALCRSQISATKRR